MIVQINIIKKVCTCLLVGGFGLTAGLSATQAQEWETPNSGTENELRAVDFANPEIGWAAGDNGEVLYTLDGGQTWERHDDAFNGDSFLHSVSFADSEHGWFSGANGTLIHTNDGGQKLGSTGSRLR